MSPLSPVVTVTDRATPVPAAANTGLSGQTQQWNFGFPQGVTMEVSPWRCTPVVPIPVPSSGTSPLHTLDAEQDETRHRPALPLAQHLQRAAENLIWKRRTQNRGLSTQLGDTKMTPRWQGRCWGHHRRVHSRKGGGKGCDMPKPITVMLGLGLGFVPQPAVPAPSPAVPRHPPPWGHPEGAQPPQHSPLM